MAFLLQLFEEEPLMKRILALAAMLTMGAMASAATVDAVFFTFETPSEGWTLQTDGENSAALASPGKTAVFSVAKMPAAGTALEEAAARMAEAHGSQDLVRMEGGGEAWEYTGTAGGQPLYSQIFDLGSGVYGCITITGAHESSAVIDVFNSIAFK